MVDFFEISPATFSQCETTEVFGFNISLQFLKGILLRPFLDIADITLPVNVLIRNEFPTSTLRLERHMVVADVDCVNNGV